MGTSEPVTAARAVPLPPTGHLTPEVPIASAREDRLGRMAFVKRFARALVNERTGQATGVTVGITGSWGTGKTSVLNLLLEYLRDSYPDALVVRFNPWSISSRHDIIGAFLGDLHAELKASDIPAEKKEPLLQSLAAYWAQLAPVSEPAPTEPLAEVDEGERKFRRNRSLHEAREALNLWLRTLDVPVVVCIDELDRLQDSEIRAIAQLVRSVADFPTISYVLAFDAFRVAEALGQGATAQERYLRGTAYLEKIIQFQFSIPLVFDNQLRDLLVDELNALDIYLVREAALLDNARFRELLGIVVPGIIETPRDVKKVAGVFHVFESMVRGEVDWVDVLAFASLSTKHPQVAEAIRAHPEFVRGKPDPTLIPVKAKTEPADKLDVLCPDAPNDPEILRLMGFLFPFFDDGGQMADSNFDRVKHERPLRTLLSLDILPNQATRLDVELFVAADSAAREAALDRLVAPSNLPVVVNNFFRRFAEVYFELSPFDEQALWRDLSAVCEKSDTAWAGAFAPRRRFIAAAEAMMHALLAQQKRYREVSEEAIAAMADRGEIALTSKLLRSEVYSHGLFDRRARVGLPHAMEAEKARGLVAKFSSRCASLMMNGDLLTRLHDFTPLWNMVSVGLWSEPCRTRLADAMKKQEAFDAVVLMTYGGDLITDPASLETVLDVDAFAARVRDRAQSGDFEALDPSLQDAYRRAATTLW